MVSTIPLRSDEDSRKSPGFRETVADRRLNQPDECRNLCRFGRDVCYLENLLLRAALRPFQSLLFAFCLRFAAVFFITEITASIFLRGCQTNAIAVNSAQAALIV
jgi:hypothetical protein